MTAVDDWDEDDDPYEPDDSDDQYEPDYDDDRDGSWEPDPEDYEIAKAYEEHAEHCETVHGGGDCDCRPTLPERAAQWLRGARYRLAAAARRPNTRRAMRRARDEPPF